jgi:proline iminopeptidase
MLSAGEHRIKINGIEHWVRVAGTDDGRPPIVVLHGGPGGNSYLCEQTFGPRLERFATIVYFDQRGCGRSEEPADPAAYTMDHLVADIEGLRAALDVDRIVPLGQSFGGRFAAAYTMAHRDRVDRLILHASPITNPLRPNAWALQPAMVHPLLQPAARAELRRELATLPDQADRFAAAHEVLNRDPAARARFLCHDPAKAPELLRILDTAEKLGTNDRMAPLLRPTAPDQLGDALAETDVPTLVLVGLSDRSVGVDSSRDLAAQLPNGQLHLFTESAHFPEHEQPDEYAAVVRAFLA